MRATDHRGHAGPDERLHTPGVVAERLDALSSRMGQSIEATTQQTVERLQTLQRATGADELVITSVTHRHSDRLRSHELIAKRWGLTG